MYSHAWNLYRPFALHLAVLCLAIVVLQAFIGAGLGFIAKLLGLGGIAFFAHRIAVLGPADEAWKQPTEGLNGVKGAFALCFCGFFIVACVIWFFASAMTLEVDVARLTKVTPLTAINLIVFFVLAGVLFLSVFGTMLPAAAVGGDFSLRGTLSRARFTFVRTFIRLMALPVFVFILAFGMQILLVRAIHLPVEIAWFGRMVSSAVGYFTSSVGVLLIAFVLSLAYSEAEEMALPAN